MIRLTGAILALLLACGGCASPNSGRFILTRVESGKQFSQRFTETLAARKVDGSYEFLLISDQPRAAGALKQVVHLNIPWLPMRGHLAETLVSNATINWYILDQNADSRRFIHYSGAGYAIARPKKKVIRLQVRSASLKPREVRQLIDPLGAFAVAGTITARNDAKRLDDLLTSWRVRLPQ